MQGRRGQCRSRVGGDVLEVGEAGEGVRGFVGDVGEDNFGGMERGDWGPEEIEAPRC